MLIAVSFVDMLGFAIILPLLPFYALEMNASAEMIGWLIASFSIAQLIASPVWGRVSDKYGRRPALMIGLFASSLAFLVFGLAESLLMLFVSRVVQGLGGGTTGVAHAYVSDTVGPLDRARALVDQTRGPGVNRLGSRARHRRRATRLSTVTPPWRTC